MDWQKTLFSSDLLAVSTGNLSLELEESEKELLRINEHFGLRGPQIDDLVLKSQQADMDKIADAAIENVSEMTLTLVDGDFPRQVIANQNLGFANYTMPATRNSLKSYDSKSHAAPNNPLLDQGIRIGQIDLETWEAQQVNARNLNRSWMIIAGCFSLGFIWTVRRRKKGSEE